MENRGPANSFQRSSTPRRRPLVSGRRTAGEVRRVGDDRWFPAGELPEIFAEEISVEPPHLVVRRRSWPEVIRETIRLYRAGFWRFMLFGLLTAVPMYVLQAAFPRIPFPDLAGGA